MLIENDVLSGNPLNKKVSRDILRSICFSHAELISGFQNGALEIP
jgi:hypothetical protein